MYRLLVMGLSLFALSAAELNLAARSDALCAPRPAGMTGWWSGDGSPEDSYSGFDGSLINGASYAPGMVGQAFLFDGVDDYVSVPHEQSLNFGTGDFTIAFWMNADGITHPDQVAISKATYDEALQPHPLHGWGLLLRPFSSRVEVQLSDAVAVQYAGGLANSITGGTWIHVAIRRQHGNEFSIFLNGALSNQIETDLITDLDNDGPLLFGAYLSNQGYYKGKIDEVLVFSDRALTDAEIGSIHAAGSDGVCPIVPVCGNARAELGEACDDGNATVGDGCEPDCTLSCGNSVVSFVEECDDSNLVDGDGCDSNCRNTACGNGIVTGVTGEICDDGNLVNGDGCDANCTVTACGNNIVSFSTGETCDDGDMIDGDGCESDCTTTPVDVVVPPGGAATTDSSNTGATPQYPRQVNIVTSTGGHVTIEDATDTVSVDGVQLLGVAVHIEAPAESTMAPLVVTLTIDASVIPPGVDVRQIQGLRDHVPLFDCTNSTVADPDPCLKSLTVLGGGDIEIVMLSSHASLWQVGARGLTKAENKCVSNMNGAGVKVMKTLAKAAAGCLKQAYAGAIADAQACLTADAGGKLSTALLKTLSAETKSCPAPTPPFGYGGGAAVNAVTQSTAAAVRSDVLGPDLSAAVAAAGGDAGAACQTAVLKLTQNLFDTRVKLFLGCAKGALKGKTTLAVSGPQLAACFSEVEADSKGKLEKLVEKLKSELATTCSSLPLTTVLPGACSSRDRPAACLNQRSKCHMCEVFDAMGALGFDCDTFDDGDVNGSCS